MTALRAKAPVPSTGRGGWRTALATAGGNAYLLLASVVCGGAAAVLGWLPPRGDWMFRIARAWSAGLLAVSGVRVGVRYEEQLDRGAAYVFVANHQSLFDIPVLLRTLPVQTRFLAKGSLFRIPFFGWGLHAGGFVPVERRDRRAARKSFVIALRRLQSKRSILLFPEETRSQDGALQPFKRGGVLLALKSGFPIVPVAIHGTRAVRPKGSHRIRPGVVAVRYGRPIPTASLAVTDRARLTAEVRRWIAGQLEATDPADGVS